MDPENGSSKWILKMDPKTGSSKWILKMDPYLDPTHAGC